MLRRISFPGWRLLAPVFAVVISLSLLAACGSEDTPTVPTATAVPAATSVPATIPPTVAPPTREPTAISEPTAAPDPTAMPEATTAPEPTEIPAPTAEPTTAPETTPALSSSNGETPAATEPAETPAPTAVPSAPPQDPCEGERGGEVGNCAPEFAGTQEWVNSDPFTMQSQLGKVVLIDFWTYSCINCIRTLPFLQTWHERYADEGLVIVGVHTPEFEFEKIYDNVVDATVDMGVAWPVVQDNDYAVWSSYNNRFWPAKYLIDKDGVIRYRHFGEGKYAETEEEIRKLLAEIGAESDALAMPLPEDQKRDSTYLASNVRPTPELFAGWVFVDSHYRAGRGLYIGQIEPYQDAARVSYLAGNQEGAVAEFVQPAQLQADMIYFHGPWSIGPESAVHARETDEYTDAIILLYSARSVNAVLTSESGEPYKVLVTVNNEYLTEENKGEDVVIGEDGESYITVASPKAYRIVEHADFEERQVLAMSSLSDDFGLFSFTFGAYEDGF